MKLHLTLALGLALASAAPALAHDGDPTAPGVHATATAEGNRAEATAIVPGTVAGLKGALYRFERWPEVFSDVRGLSRNADGSWAVDFRRFGHPHDFLIARTATGVVFTLAAKDHGAARMEWALEPVDANRSKLVVRLFMTTPPQLTEAQALGLLRAKAQADVDDFSKLTTIR